MTTQKRANLEKRKEKEKRRKFPGSCRSYPDGIPATPPAAYPSCNAAIDFFFASMGIACLAVRRCAQSSLRPPKQLS
jgi:hypothetical protein